MNAPVASDFPRTQSGGRTGVAQQDEIPGAVNPELLSPGRGGQGDVRVFATEDQPFEGKFRIHRGTVLAAHFAQDRGARLRLTKAPHENLEARTAALRAARRIDEREKL